MTLSPDESTLLAVCGGHALYLSEANWPAVFDLAARHEVAPFLAHVIRSSSGPGLPRTICDTAELVFAQSVIEQGLEEEETGRVFRALGDIPALLFKGASISRRWYPPGARAGRDLDVHISRGDYARAKAALVASGYSIIDCLDEAIQLRQTKDVGFTRRGDDGTSWTVELHVRLTEPGAPDFDPASLWERAKCLEVGGESVRVPDAEHSLILLALNLRKHRFARLKTILDIDRLLSSREQPVDVEMAVELAGRYGFRGLLLHSITLTNELLNRDRGPAHPAAQPMWTLRSGRVRAPKFERFAVKPARLLPLVANADAVLGEQRTEDGSKRTSGLIPFVSLDKLPAALHLAYARFKFGPEQASYYRAQGDPSEVDAYRTRVRYWIDIVRSVIRALYALTFSLIRSDSAEKTLQRTTQGDESRIAVAS